MNNPFSPIGEKAGMRAVYDDDAALTPTLSQNWERGTRDYFFTFFRIAAIASRY